MNRLEGRLGVNVGNLIGHSTVRYYVMCEDSQKRTANAEELKAMQDVVRKRGTGIMQCSSGRAPELKDGLLARLSETTGRTVIYNNLGQTMRDPDAWKKHMARLDGTSAAGTRAFPLCSPHRTTQTFTIKNCQVFRGTPTWHPILLASDEEKLRAYPQRAHSRRRGAYANQVAIAHSGTN